MQDNTNFPKGFKNSMQWQSISGRTGYVLTGFCLIPTYHLNDHEVILIDSGLVKSESFISFFRSMGVSVRAVLQTHLHIDHIANNRRLHDAFNTEILADENEIRSVMYPEEALADYGENARVVLQKYSSRFDYPITAISPDAEEIIIGGCRFRILRLPGHSLHHIGFVTPDDVLCCGDALISLDYLANAKMPFMADPDTAYLTIKRISGMHYPFMAPAHRQVIPGDQIRHVAEMNIAKEHSIRQCICRVSKIMESDDPDVLIPRVFETLGIRLSTSHSQQVTTFTLRQRILDLKKAGRLS